MDYFSKVLWRLGLAPTEIAAVASLPDPRVVAGWDAAFAKEFGLSLPSYERLAAAFSLGSALLGRGITGKTVRQVADFGPLLGDFGVERNERVLAVAIDPTGLILGGMWVASGGATAVAFDIAEVLRFFLRFQAFAGVLIHNHPCHDATASKADQKIAGMLKTACEAMEIDFWGFCVWAKGVCVKV